MLSLCFCFEKLSGGSVVVGEVNNKNLINREGKKYGKLIRIAAAAVTRTYAVAG